MQPSTRSRLSVAAGVFVVLLVAGAGGTAALSAPSADATSTTPPQPSGEFPLPERVVLPDSGASGTAAVGVDAGGALDQEGSRLDGAYRRYLLEERLSSADTDAQRRTILADSVQRLNGTLTELGDRERTAREAYVDGDISERAYLARISSINDEAAQLERLADMIVPTEQDAVGLADQYGAGNLSPEVQSIRGDLLARQGTVRSQIGEMLAGDRDAQRYYVSASAQGSVLGTISEGTYHREAHRNDLLAPRTERGLSLNEAYDLARNDLYPRFSSNYGFSGFFRIAPGQAYQVLGEGPYDFRSYIDAVSEDVFREYQRMDLDQALPTASPVSSASDGVTVAVHPTYETGPARVVVTEGGDPLSNVSVSVGGHTVAETGADGRAWVVLPPDAPVVTATTTNGTVSVPIEWGPDGATNAGFATS